MNVVRILIALPMVILMIGFAKVVQFSSVEAFGAELGFELASLLGLVPVIAAYMYVASRMPKWREG